jgi:hypothetical protein
MPSCSTCPPRGLISHPPHRRVPRLIARFRDPPSIFHIPASPGLTINRKPRLSHLRASVTMSIHRRFYLLIEYKSIYSIHSHIVLWNAYHTPLMTKGRNSHLHCGHRSSDSNEKTYLNPHPNYDQNHLPNYGHIIVYLYLICDTSTCHSKIVLSTTSLILFSCTSQISCINTFDMIERPARGWQPST